MYLFVESLKIENRKACAIDFHNQRMNRTRKEVFGLNNPISITDFLKIPDDLTNGIYKCRVLYGKSISEIEFHPYTPKEVRSLKLVYCDTIDYSNKTADRSELNELYAQRDEFDDIIIVKTGFLSDASSSNVIFEKDGKWYTPNTPLLCGTKRQMLLEKGILTETKITPENLKTYERVMLINALLDFDKSRAFSVKNIHI